MSESAQQDKIILYFSTVPSNHEVIFKLNLFVFQYNIVDLNSSVFILWSALHSPKSSLQKPAPCIILPSYFYYS